MLNKLYETIKKYIKENSKSLIPIVILYILVLVPVNYYITIGGGTIDIKKRVEVNNTYKIKGKMSFAYVSEIKGTLATYLLSYVMPNWKRESIDKYKYDKSDNVKDIEFRNQIDLKNANDLAIKTAFTKANKYIKTTSTKYYVIYKTKKASNKIKVGDEVLQIDGIDIKSFDQFKKIINNHQESDTIILTIKRGNSKKDIEVKLYKEKEKLLLGIIIDSVSTYKTKPEVKLNFKSAESGPSGGKMLTLAIYNQITKDDLVRGRNIVGTGTIEEDGSIGEIGGVTYKLMGAVKEKADIFLVPAGNNYKDAVKFSKKNNYHIKIVGVKTIDEAIKYLKK